jgi:hypothetical protein
MPAFITCTWTYGIVNYFQVTLQLTVRLGVVPLSGLMTRIYVTCFDYYSMDCLVVSWWVCHVWLLSSLHTYMIQFQYLQLSMYNIYTAWTLSEHLKNTTADSFQIHSTKTTYLLWGHNMSQFTCHKPYRHPKAKLFRVQLIDVRSCTLVTKVVLTLWSRGREKKRDGTVKSRCKEKIKGKKWETLISVGRKCCYRCPRLRPLVFMINIMGKWRHLVGMGYFRNSKCFIDDFGEKQVIWQGLQQG